MPLHNRWAASVRCACAAVLALALVAACDEPAGPGEPSLRNPQIAAIGRSSGFPDAYLGIFAEPTDPELRFEAEDVVEMTIVSPTGDSIALAMGRRYCQLAEMHFAICDEYVLTLDTTVAFATTQQRMRDAGFGLNPIGGARFATAFDFLGRPTAIADLGNVPAVLTAGPNSIGSLALPPLDLAGRGLHGAVMLTRQASPVTDLLLSVPDTGSVTVRYRQPNGTLLSQQISITPLF